MDTLADNDDYLDAFLSTMVVVQRNHKEIEVRYKSSDVEPIRSEDWLDDGLKGTAHPHSKATANHKVDIHNKEDTHSREATLSRVVTMYASNWTTFLCSLLIISSIFVLDVQPPPPQQAYQGGQPGYYGQQAQPQPVYVQQPPQQKKGGMGAGAGCCACLVGACACCCAEEMCLDCMF